MTIAHGPARSPSVSCATPAESLESMNIPSPEDARRSPVYRKTTRHNLSFSSRPGVRLHRRLFGQMLRRIWVPPTPTGQQL
jgi:hypothetical protein